MKKRLITSVLALSMVLSAMPFAAAAESASGSDPFAEKLTEMYTTENLEMEYRPEARWWLAEGSHTDETLIESIHELYDAGFGAVEFVTLDESDYLDDSTYAWGSEEWIHDTHVIMRECTKLGMGVSFTSGTNWATANLVNITPDDDAASQELSYRTVNVAAGQTYNDTFPLPELPSGVTVLHFEKLIAAKVVDAGDPDGKTIVPAQLDPDSLVDLSDLMVDNEDGTWSVNWTAPEDGDYILFGFWRHGTGESYKPAVTGQSYTINYMDEVGAEALIAYWNENVLDDEMKQLILENGDVQMYMDSLELNPRGANGTKNLWAADFLEEFEERAGYDLSLYLPILIANNAGGLNNNPTYRYTLAGESDLCDNIRYDLYQVNTELYEEECLDVLTEWLHSVGIKLRAENSYGKLLEISEPMDSIDYVETESLEFGTEIDAYRGMSGGAHVYDKVMSSETGALLFANYTKSAYYWRNVFYTQFAAGVQRTVTHGYSSAYGPEEHVSWPGFEGMGTQFSERFNRRQPNAIDYSDQFGGQVTRLQKVLRQGQPQMDLAILRTDYNFNCGIWTMNLANTRLQSNTGWYWTDQTLQNNGYTYDYFSPYLLEDITYEDGVLQPDGPSYQAVLLYQEEMPYESALILKQWAADGLPIVIVEGASEESVMGTSLTKVNQGAAITTGSNDGKDEALAAVMAEIKAMDNVVCVESQADAYEALLSLGVEPRTEYAQANQTLLPVLRKTDDVTYLYLYNYNFDETGSFAGTVAVEGIYEPYILNTWSGETTKVGNYSYEDGRTLLNVELDNGSVMVFALNPDTEGEANVVESNADMVTVENGVTTLYVGQSGTATAVYADGTAYQTKVTVPEVAFDGQWNLTVESWEPGEKVSREEDRGLGYVSKEVTYTTEKREIEVGETELVAWSEIESVGSEVSGVGTYTNTFTLPEDWDSAKTALEFDAASFGGGTAALWVNGEKVAVDMDNGKADISDVVVPGSNTIEVRVTSSLRNVMNKVGYSGWFGKQATDTYGMIGEVSLNAYTKVTVAPVAVASLALNGAASVTANVEKLEYTVTAANVEDLATVTLTFDVGNLENPVVKGADENWHVIAQDVSDGKLTAVMVHETGVTASEATGIAILQADVPNQVGDVTVRLENAVLSAFVGDSEAFLSSSITTDSVTTYVDYSIYDVNMDGVVNQLDITRAQRAYGATAGDSNWNARADVDGSGKVEIEDFIYILLNYTK